ncbi:MAG: CPBP family glutamic-type intramembrane protease, partial [Planctomycetota bacterium]|nr:CPBP family glutamic-type intramembrane protease [Planctomycetota bacterium]
PRALPLTLLYLMPSLLNYPVALTGSQSPEDNAAAAWLRALWAALGPRGSMLLTLGVALGLGAVVWIRAREATRDRGVYGGMLIEGLCYGALLGTVANVLATRLPMERVVALSAEVGGPSGALQGLRAEFQSLGLAIGAGIFEELIFRGALLAGLFALLRHAIGADRFTAGGIAVLASAYLFSDYHHWGATGEPYDAHVFAFRFHAGILLGGLYLYRGLGIAAFAHGFYDVLVMVGN